jgi:hypothetical protein
LDQAFINDLYIKASLGHISHSEFWQLQGFENWQEVEKDYLDSSITLDNNFIKAISRFPEIIILPCFQTILVNGLHTSVKDSVWISFSRPLSLVVMSVSASLTSVSLKCS